MGQKTSTLRRKFRTVKADARFQNRIDGSLSRITSSDEESAMLCSSSVESVKQSITRTSSQTSHPIRESDTDTDTESLLKLPTDLILEIAEYLPPSSYMSLSYSCRRIRNGMGASIEHVLGDKLPMGRWSATTLSVEMRNVRSLERLEWRRMLDRDGKNPSPKVFCSGCLRVHDRSLFSIQSLTQPDTKRYCLGSAGRVWICPHRSLDHAQFMGLLKEPKKAPRCECRSVSMYGEFYDTCSYGTTSFRDCSSGSFIRIWPIVKMPQHGLPSNQDVEETLRLLKAPMCPHLRLNDACVANAYLIDCAMPQRGCSLPSRPDLEIPMLSSARAVCIYCGIRIQFIQARLISPKTLSLAIFRRLESPKGHATLSCTDRGWICQVAQPADIEEYEEAWEATNVNCWRRNRDYFIRA